MPSPSTISKVDIFTTCCLVLFVNVFKEYRNQSIFYYLKIRSFNSTSKCTFKKEELLFFVSKLKDFVGIDCINGKTKAPVEMTNFSEEVSSIYLFAL